ncbi:MAG: hypothetical protein SVU88_01920 [Candidatus Nanohaloarchaea archaeon]|nr:hypothetical protein [Candidatus Nanohaloarchaea archaeon]
MVTKTIRGVDEELFNRFKSKAAEEGVTVGEAVNMAMLEWLSEEAEVSIMELEPVSWGEETANLSENVDAALYGGE